MALELSKAKENLKTGSDLKPGAMFYFEGNLISALENNQIHACIAVDDFILVINLITLDEFTIDRTDNIKICDVSTIDIELDNNKPILRVADTLKTGDYFGSYDDLKLPINSLSVIYLTLTDKNIDYGLVRVYNLSLNKIEFILTNKFVTKCNLKIELSEV